MGDSKTSYREFALTGRATAFHQELDENWEKCDNALEAVLEEAKAYTNSRVTNSGGVRPSFRYSQEIPATSWVIVHNLGFQPQVVVIDSSGHKVYGDVVYDNANQCTVSFSAPFGGITFLS